MKKLFTYVAAFAAAYIAALAPIAVPLLANGVWPNGAQFAAALLPALLGLHLLRTPTPTDPQQKI